MVSQLGVDSDSVGAAADSSEAAVAATGCSTSMIFFITCVSNAFAFDKN